MAQRPAAATDAIVARVTGVVLAGGKARRMGGVDKGLVAINGRAMVGYVIDALRPQVANVMINANRSHDRYREFGLPVIADADRDFRGPLAGIASAMQAADTPYVAVAPCDSPLLCPDLVARLHAALQDEGRRISVAHDGTRLQPVFALLERSLLDDLAGHLADGGRKIDAWYAKHGFAVADCSDVPESFLNINAPDDRRLLEDRLAQRGSA